jgi:hypothetical protein
MVKKRQDDETDSLDSSKSESKIKNLLTGANIALKRAVLKLNKLTGNSDLYNELNEIKHPVFVHELF